MRKDLTKARLREWCDLLDEMRSQRPPITVDGLARPNKSVARAFEYFGLDPQKHQAALLTILADVLFGPRPNKGRPRKNTGPTAALFRLGQCWLEVTTECHEMSDSAAAGEIRRRFPRYGCVTEDRIRQQLRAARLALGQLTPLFEFIRAVDCMKK